MTRAETRKLETPSRFRAVRSDASIDSIQKKIEGVFRLPTGSIKLVYPSGRKARADATVGAFLRNWAQNG
jgi:hypothetical protein